MTQPAPLYPKALKPGDKIGIVAPSSYHDVEKLRPAVGFLTDKGFEVIFHPQTALKNGQFAGTPQQKVDAIHDYFTNPDIKAIFCTCGGNGAIHLLDKIDYKLIAENPKIFIGFSDITLLLNAISAKTGLVTFHGPTLTRIDKIEPRWREQMITLLTGESNGIEIDTDLPDATGTLYGGNLSVMQALIGTPYAPVMDNAILLLEDINDHLSRYDRMLAHMKHSGWLKSLNAIILGDFLKSQDNPERPFGVNIKEITANQAANIPILDNFPIGHGAQLCTLPIGANIALKNGRISFKSLI